jgi:putative cell wall-binding protein
VLAGVFISRPRSRVVVVNERDYAGTLAGGVLARANLAPVIVTPASGLTGAAKAELRRLAPIGAYLIGGEGSLSPQVAADLAATGIPPDQITRIAGGSRAHTAALVAGAMDKRTAQQKQARVPAFDAAIVVNPDSPDAASVAALAANRRLPVLLVGKNAVPPETSDALKGLAIQHTLVIGGRRWIGRAVAAQLPGPKRLAGGNAVGTSRAVVGESIRRGLPTNLAFSVESSQPMYAAVMGAAVGRIGGLLMLSPGGPPAARQALQRGGLRSKVDRLIVAERARKKGGR